MEAEMKKWDAFDIFIALFVIGMALMILVPAVILMASYPEFILPAGILFAIWLASMSDKVVEAMVAGALLGGVYVMLGMIIGALPF
jgi:hypothetical protein